MLGCKFLLNIFIKTSLHELIDTCWDVNQINQIAVPDALLELIDTCWDVNDYRSRHGTPQLPGINRYMLGCK